MVRPANFDTTYTEALVGSVYIAAQDAVAANIWKMRVRAASVGNLTLSGAQTVDGVSLVAGDRVLVKDQSTGSANGIYVVQSGAWERAFDMDADDEVPGALVHVLTGGTNANRIYQNTNTGTIVLDTTALTFAEFLPSGAVTTSDLHIHAVGEVQTADGTSSTYYLAQYPEDDTVAVYVAGLRTDATQAADAITFSGTPPVGAALRFDYLAEMT